MNRDALLKQMDSFIGEFTEFRTMLESGDREGMMEKMKRSTDRRALFDKPKEC
jgi:prephenate dehydrogenase